MAVPTLETEKKDSELTGLSSVIKGAIEQRSEDSSKGKYDDVIHVKFPRNEKIAFKALCAANGISMNDFVLFAIDHIKTGIERGELSVSKFGIKEL